MAPEAELRMMTLRYAATCSRCHVHLPPRTKAAYDRLAKAVTCRDCLGTNSDEPTPAHVVTEAFVDPGVAGASARREYDRRRARREQEILEHHPRLGRLVLALSDDPQSTRAWGSGAVGEERLGAALDRLRNSGVRVLHDRRLPRTKANIDHIAFTSTGIYVIDAKRHRGRHPRKEVQGGLLRPRTERLVVGGRDGTAMVNGMFRQVQAIQAEITRTPAPPQVPRVTGVLCFIDGEWPMIGGSFAIDGVHVEWPRKTLKRLKRDGLLDDTSIEFWYRRIAEIFPRA